MNYVREYWERISSGEIVTSKRVKAVYGRLVAEMDAADESSPYYFDEAVGDVPAGEPVDLGLRDALRAVPEHLRLPLLLHHMEGYSLQEVADMLHISVAAARGRVYQARQKLRQQLDKEEQQP